MQNIKLDFEAKDNNNVVKLTVKPIVFEDREEADRVYAARIASLIRDRGNRKLLLRDELEQFLKDNGVWTEEDEKKIQSISKEIEQLFNKLKKGGDKAWNGRQLCINIMDKRKEMLKVASKKQQLDSVTIESIAENDRLDYYVYSCTVYSDDGKNFWESFEDMKNDRSSDVYLKSYINVMKYLYGVDPEYEKNLPENKWLRKYGFINENLEYTDRKTGEKVDKSGNSIKQLEKEIQEERELLEGEIKEEQPFVDDETNEPIQITQTVQSV